MHTAGNRFVATLLAAVALALMLPAAARAESVKIVGTVSALADDDLAVATSSGAVTHVQLRADVRISVRAPADVASIAAHSYVGATAAPAADGTLEASEVHIFPEAMRGTGEGHRPMDGPVGTTMTNATVASVATRRVASSMTNATVASVGSGPQGRKLVMQYPGGTQTIVVPDGTPVVTIEPGDRAALKPGTHVIVMADRAATGALVATRISAGRNGSTPPI